MTVPVSPDSVTSLLTRVTRADGPPFALLRRCAPGIRRDSVELLIGSVRTVERLADLPVGHGPDGTSPALALVPFRQIAERGFEVRDDGTPLAVLAADEAYELPLSDVLGALPGHAVEVEDGGFDIGDDAYADLVRDVLAEEIGSGEGANFVVRRTYRGRLPGFCRADALALFRRLLAGERGAYWTFAVHTGARTLVGASPEAHVRMSGGTVVMNPISGTFRYPPGGPRVPDLLRFLGDRKETDELSMVVDEELKMMCAVGDRGGVVVGPRLKEMAHLAHTEYELRGRSSLDVREVLRQTMFAATVTGSPLQNACRVIARHEPTGRGYYGGALALLGRDAGGAQTLDSPILIRTADIDADGGLRVGVGATLVRHSDPRGEAAETRAKAAGVLAALGAGPGAGHAGPGPRPGPRVPRLADDPRVRAALDARRADLAPFWLRMHTGGPGDLRGHALVVDAEDTFTSMLAHLLRSTGLAVTVRRHDEPGLRDAVAAHEGPVVLGPGPGDPADARDPRIAALRGLAGELVSAGRRGLLGVCLGHELIAAELGLDVVRRPVPHQGAQIAVDLFGRRETVGFYNSFTARCDAETEQELAAHGIEVSRDAASGDVHALRGPGFASWQFHAESVLTLDGPRLVAALVGGATASGGAGAVTPVEAP
jgi:2-amino-4-deoxychorismate synthase